MSDIQLYLLETATEHDEALRLAKRTATRLEAKQIKLVELIETLGEYLNNEDASIRVKTTAYLADVLDHLPGKVLARQQRELLCDFILSRISLESEGTIHCARGLRILERLGRFDQERVKTVINTVLEHTRPLVRSKSQLERFEILRLLDLFFDRYRAVLQDLHTEDVTNLPRIVSYVDGEKDPRNLMIIFSIFKVIMTEWNVSRHAQDLFDAVFNYFPITFRPPPNDPYGVTAQDLKDRIRDCIASTSHFAPYAFPALLDKLDSTSANVKRDALQALIACIVNYGAATINLYSLPLWDAVKFEILNVEEEDLATAALQVLYEIAFRLSFTSHEDPLQSFLRSVCKECNEHLEDAPTKQSSAAGTIIGRISQASTRSSDIIIKATLPRIMQLYKSSGSLPRRRGLLEVLILLIKSNASVFGRWRELDGDGGDARSTELLHKRSESNTLINFSQQSLDTLRFAVTETAVHEVSFRLLALEGFESLAVIHRLLDDDDISRICQLLDDIIIKETPYGKEEVKAKSIDVLVLLARQKPQKIIETAIPAFLAQLPETDVDTDQSYVPILEAFAKLSCEAQVFGTIILRLKNKLYASLRLGASSKYVTAILSAVLYAFTNGAVDLKNPTICGQYYQDIAIPLLKDIVAIGQQSFTTSLAVHDEMTYDLIGRICNVILRSQPWVAQTEICRSLYPLFRTDDAFSIPPFNTAVPLETFLSLATSTHLLAALRQQASPHTNLPELLTALTFAARTPGLSPAIVSGVLTQISLLVNKYIPAAQTTDLLIPLLSSLMAKDAALAALDLRIAFSILKALTLRMDPQLANILPIFLKSLESHETGAQTARLFGQMLAPDPALTKENHCRIYALHRARLFNLLTPQMVSLYRGAASAPASTPVPQFGRDTCLTALTGFVQHVPYDLLKAELESITPLIMQSLALSDAEVKAAAIFTVARIVSEDPAVLESHVGSLVNRLLAVVLGDEQLSAGAPTALAKLIMSSGTKTEAEKPRATLVATSPHTRAAALACLASIPASLKDASLLPYQRQVVRRLGAALDDRRRAVRAEAVRCRMAWSGLAGVDAGDADEE